MQNDGCQMNHHQERLFTLTISYHKKQTFVNGYFCSEKRLEMKKNEKMNNIKIKKEG